MSSLKSKLTASVKQAKASSGVATPRTEAASAKVRNEAASEKPQKGLSRPEKVLLLEFFCQCECGCESSRALPVAGLARLRPEA